MDNKTIQLHTIATFQGKEYELENLLNDLLNKLEEKDKEIERLKAREEECMNAYLRARQDVSEYEGKYVVAKYVIDELEKWAKEELEHPNWASCGARCMLDKLKELKEGK